MINTTDLSEFEVLLPGSWIRTDTGEIYSFTTDRMELRDERLFKELYITDPKDGQKRRSLPYALTIEDDYCGILAGDQEFVINSITKHPDGSMDMEWKDRVNTLISFHRNM
jgi:hypothetical protein